MALMAAPLLKCPDPVLRPGAWGIARVAVDDTAANAVANPQLIVTFEEHPTLAQPVTPPLPPYLLNARSYSLTGGERLFPHITKAEPDNPLDPVNPRVRLSLDGNGDFSIYTLSVAGSDVDPFFASRKLRFRLDCDDPFDCRAPDPTSPPVPELPIAIEYLAKDYSSFRQALLDFIPTRLPAWTERSEADLGMMLLELFAATADNLSYVQDRVANEAFLGTASQRRSVAGHLALIGYVLDEGASAHTWLRFQVSATFDLLAATPEQRGLRVSNDPRRPDEPVIVFETLSAATLRPEHNRMALYNWENQACCLPRQSLQVALDGKHTHLHAGDYILFDDGAGQRDVVRLIDQPTLVAPNSIKAKPTDWLTVIRWSPTTPLRYDYCAPHTFAAGNLVVATHGETVVEDLRNLSAEQRADLTREIAARQSWQRVPRQRLTLSRAPLAHLEPSTLALAAPVPTGGASSFGAPPNVLARAGPSISTLQLAVKGSNEAWTEKPSLLDSVADDPVFRVDIDDRGDATIVFGDGIFGRRPDETATVTATYRVGGGKVGNLGSDTLVRLRPRSGQIMPVLLSVDNAVSNPLPATGGRDLESREHARRFAPEAFEKPLVAVTAADYESAALELTDLQGQRPIQRANAAFRWTGSWLTVTLAVDPSAAEGLTTDVRQALIAFLDTRRLAGYDLEVRRALYVSIDLAVEFCVAPGFRAPDVQHNLERVLSNADLPNGAKGFFHPDNFTFGDNLYVSKLFLAISAVPGVESADIARFCRLWAGRPDIQTAANLTRGSLDIGLDEIVRLDNDRNLPQNGVLSIRAKGVTR